MKLNSLRHAPRNAGGLAQRVGVAAIGLGLMLATPGASALAWESVLEWLETQQNEMSAWAVTTKQTAVSANQMGQSQQISQQQLATAIGALSMSNRVSQAVLSFDGTLGQPVTIKCEAQKDATLQVQAWQQVGLDRAHLMNTFASTRVANEASVGRERMALHKDSYCTIGEAKVGMCELQANGMQGWDSNYGGAFAETTLAAEGELAGYAYAAMLADTRAPAALDCTSAACAAAAGEQLAVAAVGTMVADALVGQVLERRVPMMTGQ